MIPIQAAIAAVHLVIAPYTAPLHIAVPPTHQRGLHVAKAPRVVRTERGVASVWTLEGYEETQGWSQTAWGRFRYDESGYLTAHRTAPRGSVLLVTNLRNGLSKHVTVADRGPRKIWEPRWKAYRVVDVSPPTARALRMTGLDPVKVEWVQ